MPFKSKAQQRLMFAKHPRMAKRWAQETDDIKGLPEKVKKSAAYKLHGHMKFQGLNISIENRKGSVRRWHDPHGKETGSTKMHCAYGYIKKTKGTDGDHVDAYVGPKADADQAFIVNQMKKPPGDIKKDGKAWTKFDEQKVMLGFASEKEAKAAYFKQYDDPRFFGSIKAMPMAEFKEKVLMKSNHGLKVAMEQKNKRRLARAGIGGAGMGLLSHIQSGGNPLMTAAGVVGGAAGAVVGGELGDITRRGKEKRSEAFLGVWDDDPGNAPHVPPSERKGKKKVAAAGVFRAGQAPTGSTRIPDEIAAHHWKTWAAEEKGDTVAAGKHRKNFNKAYGAWKTKEKLSSTGGTMWTEVAAQKFAQAGLGPMPGQASGGGRAQPPIMPAQNMTPMGKKPPAVQPPSARVPSAPGMESMPKIAETLQPDWRLPLKPPSLAKATSKPFSAMAKKKTASAPAVAEAAYACGIDPLPLYIALDAGAMLAKKAGVGKTLLGLGALAGVGTGVVAGKKAIDKSTKMVKTHRVGGVPMRQAPGMPSIGR